MADDICQPFLNNTEHTLCHLVIKRLTIKDNLTAQGDVMLPPPGVDGLLKTPRQGSPLGGAQTMQDTAHTILHLAGNGNDALRMALQGRLLAGALDDGTGQCTHRRYAL